MTPGLGACPRCAGVVLAGDAYCAGCGHRVRERAAALRSGVGFALRAVLGLALLGGGGYAVATHIGRLHRSDAPPRGTRSLGDASAGDVTGVSAPPSSVPPLPSRPPVPVATRPVDPPSIPPPSPPTRRLKR